MADRSMTSARTKLLPDELVLLREVVARHAPLLLPLTATIGARALEETECEELREALAEEFAASGLNEDSEPNERGLRLESIIDKLGHL